MPNLYTINTGNPGHIVSEVMSIFGLNAHALPGTEQERGKFFIHRQPTPAMLPEAEADDLKNTRHILFTGIDTSGKDYLKKYANALSGTLIDAETPLLTYHYKTSAESRGQDLAALYHNEGYASSEAKDVANALFDAKYDPQKLPEHTVIFFHSFGGIFSKMVLNALSERALKEYDQDRNQARAFLSRFTAIGFGVKPPWRAQHDGGASPYLDIQRDTVEIYVAALDDMMPYTPAYVTKAYADLLKSKPCNGVIPSYLLLDHEADGQQQETPPKFFALIGPGLMPPLSEEGNRNLGGHHLPHYINALGFTRHPTPHPDHIGDLGMLQLLIAEAIHHPASFKDSSLLSDSRRTVRHTDHTFVPDENTIAEIQRIWAEQIKRESTHWTKSPHPLLAQPSGASNTL